MLQEQWLHWSQRRSGVFLGVTGSTCRDDVSSCVASAFRQWRDVVLCQFALAPLVAVGTSVVMRYLQCDPLFCCEVVDYSSFDSGSASSSAGLHCGRIGSVPCLSNSFGLLGVVSSPLSHDRISSFFVVGSVVSAVLSLSFWIGVVSSLGLCADAVSVLGVVGASCTACLFRVQRSCLALAGRLAGSDLFKVGGSVSALCFAGLISVHSTV